jgi:hypothetical protein
VLLLLPLLLPLPLLLLAVLALVVTRPASGLET